MEQQLANIKLRFFTDISHELRTPLTLISSPVTEVLENEPLSPSAREHLTLVHQNTERMLRLMNQILDFRKIQNQKMKQAADLLQNSTLPVSEISERTGFQSLNNFRKIFFKYFCKQYPE